jgi:hypothetical protein
MIIAIFHLHNSKHTWSLREQVFASIKSLVVKVYCHQRYFEIIEKLRDTSCDEMMMMLGCWCWNFHTHIMRLFWSISCSLDHYLLHVNNIYPHFPKQSTTILGHTTNKKSQRRCVKVLKIDPFCFVALTIVPALLPSYFHQSIKQDELRIFAKWTCGKSFLPNWQGSFPHAWSSEKFMNIFLTSNDARRAGCSIPLMMGWNTVILSICRCDCSGRNIFCQQSIAVTFCFALIILSFLMFSFACQDGLITIQQVDCPKHKGQRYISARGSRNPNAKSMAAPK